MGTPINDLIDRTLKYFPTLYDYQEEAVRSTISRTRKTLGKLLLILPTAAGKSYIIAAMSAVFKAIADEASGENKRVLVLAPGQELVEQNSVKMLSHGFDVGVYCAGLNKKQLQQDIIFGSAQSVIGSIDEFKDLGISALFLDEAHSHPPTVVTIIEELLKVNPNLRVIGTTATPYRLGRGYIYLQNTFLGHAPLTEDYARDPFFDEVVFEISPHALIEMGKILPPIIGATDDHYDTQGLKKTNTGSWDKKSEDKVFVEGKSELTKKIVQDVKRKSRDRHGVMIFAQNVEHAKLILSYLPKNTSALITAETKPSVREDTIRDFKAGQKIKYLINVGTLTTGFDAPIVDVIAVLRTTESASLFQQIIGRGIRLFPEIGKKDCLVLDYAQNMDRFAPDGDIFTPEITASKPGAGTMTLIDVTCPTCQGDNRFRPLSLVPGTVINDHGYLQFEGFEGPILSESREPIAGHMGAQCRHYHEDEHGNMVRCPQTWSSRVCGRCSVLNAQSATFCKSCHEPLSETAKRIGNRAAVHPEALYAKRIAQVLRMGWVKTKSKNGNETLKMTFELQELPFVTFDDEGQMHVNEAPRESITIWVSPHIQHAKAREAWANMIASCATETTWDIEDVTEGRVLLDAPEYITFQLKPPMPGQSEPRFYDILEFHDEHPMKEKSPPKRANELRSDNASELA